MSGRTSQKNVSEFFVLNETLIPFETSEPTQPEIEDLIKELEKHFGSIQ